MFSYSLQTTKNTILFVLMNCVFWSFMDVFVFGVKDGHTIFYIYIPVSSIFLFAWWSLAHQWSIGLRFTQRFCEMILIGLSIYACYLFTTQVIWGAVTLLFLPLFIYVRASFRHYDQQWSVQIS